MFRTSRVALLAGLLSVALVAPSAAASPPTGPAGPVLVPTAVVDSSAPIPTTAGLRAQVLPALGRSALGKRAVVVLDPATGDELLSVGADRPLIPASTLKLLTASAALSVLGPAARLETTVVTDDATAKVVTLTLVGAGDATLTRKAGGPWASLADLAGQVAEAVPVGTVVVRFDDSAFTGPELGPGWPTSFPRAGIVAPVTALMVDQGRVSPGARARVSNPARQAAQVFASMLRDRGLEVRSVRKGEAPDGASVIARVQSPPVATLVQRMLTESDNDLAEALAHLVGGAKGQQASFAGGAQAVMEVAAESGFPTQGLTVVDGSGLSAKDRVAPRTLGAVLVSAARADDAARSIINPGLAVAGFTGTLGDRFQTGADREGKGVVRGKTGTLSGVVSLAGNVRSADGRVLVFAVLGNDVRSEVKGRAALDAFASRLAGCGCR